MARNQRGSEISKKEDEHQKDQCHPDREILHDRAQGHLNQVGSVVIGDGFVAFGRIPELFR